MKSNGDINRVPFCLGCQRPLTEDTAKVSIFERDKELHKCFAYKIQQITGEDLMFSGSVRFVCLDCRDLLAQIYSLELKFKNGYYGLKTDEEVEVAQGLQDPDNITEYLDEITKVSEEFSEKKLKPPMTCKICHETFENGKKRKEHIIEAHPDHWKNPLFATNTDPHMCHLCSKVYASRRNLKAHMMSHTGEKPHECNVCQMKFSRKEYLKRHMVKHTGERNHHCKDCGKSFPGRTNLISHQRSIHGKDTPYKCKDCDYRTTTGLKLREHIMAAHTGEKPYACEQCDKRFVRKQGLDIHMREVHMGIKYVRKSQRPPAQPDQKFIVVARNEEVASSDVHIRKTKRGTTQKFIMLAKEEEEGSSDSDESD